MDADTNYHMVFNFKYLYYYLYVINSKIYIYIYLRALLSSQFAVCKTLITVKACIIKENVMYDFSFMSRPGIKVRKVKMNNSNT